MSDVFPYSMELAVTKGPHQTLYQVLTNTFEIPGFSLVVVWPMEAWVSPVLQNRMAAYRTATHALEAMRAMDLYSAMQFEVGGLFDTYAMIDEWPDSFVLPSACKGYEISNQLLQSCRDAHLRACGMMGLVARFVGNVDVRFAKYRWNVCMGHPLPTQHLALVWEVILKAKFVLGSMQADLLLSTGTLRLLNHSRSAVPTSYACGLMVGDVLVGHNMAGKYLMALREDLLNELKEAMATKTTETRPDALEADALLGNLFSL